LRGSVDICILLHPTHIQIKQKHSHPTYRQTRQILELRPKPNTFQQPYFITHTSLLFEFSIEKKYSRLAGKYSRSRSTVFSRKMRWIPPENTFPWVSILFLGTPYILRKSNRRILKRSEIKSPNFEAVEIKSPHFEAVEVSMAQVEEKRNTVAERCLACLANPHRNRISVE
jgi:hypothetical protein